MGSPAVPPNTSTAKDDRRHHKVPIALLGRFTDDGTDDGVLYVGDPLKLEWRPSTPRAECAERGYYSVDAEGCAPGEIDDYARAIQFARPITQRRRVPRDLARRAPRPR